MVLAPEKKVAPKKDAPKERTNAPADDPAPAAPVAEAPAPEPT
jgi:hypothetical protein